jgi:Membrane protein putatively involved in post-translational modification of the autoinducing quorum-sensing peptide
MVGGPHSFRSGPPEREAMAIEALAHRLAAMLAQELSLSDDDREIAAFALHGIFSVSFYLATLLVTGWILGLLGSAVMVAVTVGVLRTFMGGAHASTAWRCGITGATLMNLGAWAARELQGMAVLQNVEVQLGGALLSAAAALLAIHLYCPADVPAKPITDPRQRKRLRRISRWLVAGAWLPLMVIAATRGWADLYFSATAGLWIQLLLVTPVGFVWSERLDGYLTKLMRKEE